MPLQTGGHVKGVRREEGQVSERVVVRVNVRLWSWWFLCGLADGGAARRCVSVARRGNGAKQRVTGKGGCMHCKRMGEKGWDGMWRG